MEKANQGAQETIPENTTNDSVNAADMLISKLVSLGFEESLCKQVVQLTNDQEKAIELLKKLKEELTATLEESKKKQEEDARRHTQKAIQGVGEIESYKMVCIVRTDLSMRAGKVAAQVGHAALGAYQDLIAANRTDWNEDLAKWEENGPAKIVLKAKNKEELVDMHNRAKEAGLNTHLVIDEGRTQIEPGSYTVCSIGPARSTLIDKITGHLKLM